jgi:hypothetical protein
MNAVNATTTYVIPEPFDRAVKSVRAILSGANLRITGEMNMSGRIERALQVSTVPCRVFFATLAAADSDSAAMEGSSGGFTPLHIVVAARGPQSEVHLLKFVPRDGRPADVNASAALERLRAAISEAVERIGMRASFGA